MADLLRKLHTEVSVCSVFWYTLIHDLVYDIQHIVLQKSIRHTKRNVSIERSYQVCVLCLDSFHINATVILLQRRTDRTLDLA